MHKKTKNLLLSAAIILTIAVVFIVSSWAWLSLGPMNQAKEKVYSILPFPAAVVAGQPIAMKTYITRYELAKKFAEISGTTTPPDLGNLIFNQLVAEAKIQVLAQKAGVAATGKEVETEYERRVAASAAAGQTDFTHAIEAYGLDTNTYKNEVIKNDVTASNLAAWFFGQRDLNAPAYGKADEIQQKLGTGQDFSALAKAYSQDSQTIGTGGDTGFVTENQMLPEVASAVKKLNTGQTGVIPDRYGLEIIKFVGQDNNGPGSSQRWHLQHIFLAGSDFNSWFSQTTKDFKIIKILFTNR